MLLRLRRLRLRRLRRLRPDLLSVPALVAPLAGAIWVNFGIPFTSPVRSGCPTLTTVDPPIRRALGRREKVLTSQQGSSTRTALAVAPIYPTA